MRSSFVVTKKQGLGLSSFKTRTMATRIPLGRLKENVKLLILSKPLLTTPPHSKFWTTLSDLWS